MSGGKERGWKEEELTDGLLGKAMDFGSARRDAPFFLYFAMNEPHVPRAPHPRFVGASGMGPRGDTIVQFDWTVGALMDKLGALGIAADTLVILRSDTGPILFDGYGEQAVELGGDQWTSGP